MFVTWSERFFGELFEPYAPVQPTLQIGLYFVILSTISSRNSVINSLWLFDAIWWQPMLTSHEWGSGGIHLIVTSHWASNPLCYIMSLKIILLKLLPPLPGMSEVITCRQIGDKAYLYRPTQITERFPIFFSSGDVWSVSFDKQVLLTCWGFNIGNNVRNWIRK